jgi:hypothetical protein
MAIKFFCELCGKEMGTAPAGRIKEFSKKFGDKCDQCIKMESDLGKFFESRKSIFLNKFNELVKESKDDLVSEIANMIEERTRQFDLKLLMDQEAKREILKKDIKEIEGKR